MRAVQAAQPRTAADEEAELRAAAAPMAVSDAIQRMLLAWRDRDYFRRSCLAITSSAPASIAAHTVSDRWGRRPKGIALRR